MLLSLSKMYWINVIAVISGITCVSSHTNYGDRIPNGYRVPHPCGGGQTWEGVGHHYPGGARGTGGIRNRFGIDFKLAGLMWTHELCRKDSDMDGLTNGEELGDPNCNWKQGDVPEMEAKSHPGICEPIDSVKCQEHNERFGDRLDCAKVTKHCPALSEPGMKSKDLRFPLTPIPGTETVYKCMAYDLPTDGDFHLASTTPIINNTDIVHHMILFGCDFPENFNKTVLYRMKAAPYTCEMTPHKYCNHFLGTWTYGHPGDCWSKEAGFRIGRYGTKVAALQIHWNNPRKLLGQKDSSGMTIHYTGTRRPNDASMFILGQEYLEIPPRSNGVTFSSVCPSECTREMFQEKIYITRAANHMHYYGKKQRISIYRNGTKIRDLTDEDNYNYDHPIFHHFNPPVEVLPGDDIVTECTYASDKVKTIKFGAGTSDEMCYGFLTYYPRQNFLQTLCIQWKSVQRCVRKLPKFKGIYNGCEWRSFTEGSNKAVISQAFSNDTCGYYHHHKICSSNCTDFSQKILQHPCLQGDLGDFIGKRTKMPIDILRSCAESSAESSANRVTFEAVAFASLVICYLHIQNLYRT
ncbi:dopamine beta-hydroxylase-like isoform X2 [Mercenaria mercenaria]|uniref:dopamine beta-hydroxylase-like isoform X2 n=1 Tax=Mercenaria mercenaria TaxID=6596 RepID=UPI00234EE15F|nr:dopamine beta-hydroxylase-like isoform X2 [Mercenaria mercenaria]